jgi:hypothetical protein
MALMNTPHHSQWWGFCFPACRSLPQASQPPDQQRLARLHEVTRRSMLAQPYTLLPRDFMCRDHQVSSTMNRGLLMERIMDMYLELG